MSRRKPSVEVKTLAPDTPKPPEASPGEVLAQITLLGAKRRISSGKVDPNTNQDIPFGNKELVVLGRVQAEELQERGWVEIQEGDPVNG